MADEWEGVAWRLWRRKHLTFVEISEFLAQEGYAVSPSSVARSVNFEAGRRLTRLYSERQGGGDSDATQK